jgi:hypothetical protein
VPFAVGKLIGDQAIGKPPSSGQVTAAKRAYLSLFLARKFSFCREEKKEQTYRSGGILCAGTEKGWQHWS